MRMHGETTEWVRVDAFVVNFVNVLVKMFCVQQTMTKVKVSFANDDGE